MEQKLLDWIKGQQSIIDQVIYDAGNTYYKINKLKDNFSFDFAECQSESFNLINNKDLCYDRPNTAFVYSLWYHARRVNTFIKFFASAILKSDNKVIEIFDLGAGTGAVQFAVGLVYLGMKAVGINPPSIRLINIDSSPIMLYYNRDFLWKSFLSHYPVLQDNSAFITEYSINSWNVNPDLQVSNPWLVASYLFDMSDQKDIVTKDFLALINYYKPDTFLLLTSNQSEKVKLFHSVIERIKSEGYLVDNIKDSSLLFDGFLNKVNAFRSELGKLHPGRGVSSSTNWRDSSFIGAILKQTTARLNLTTKPSFNKIDLYNPKIKVRKDVVLSNEQRDASIFLERASIIIGPAGSGKSIVITEKIKNICENGGYSPSIEILITSFNKGLIRKLGDWIENLLKPNYGRREFIKDIYGHADETCKFYFNNSTIANITLLNFDLLPTQLAKLTAGKLIFDEQHKYNIANCISQLKLEEKIVDNKHDSILNPEFIYEEYHRIFYGLSIKNEDDYLKIERKGRWIGLKREQRELIYKCIKKYEAHNDRNNIDSIISRRKLFLNKLITGNFNLKYDYIFVDEFQDCTKADYEIFYNMIKDVNNLTLAGDLAQAIHIGKSADIPRDEKMRRRKYFLLDGSYRLPHRISESIKNLSSVIVERWRKNEATKEIAPVKNSPPGARPIIIYATSMDSMVQKVKAVLEVYFSYDIKKISILEKDNDFFSALSKIGVSCETDTILKLKGLEKECILWSTRIDIDDENEAYEFVYTILTRTSSILIIALSDTTKIYYKKIINYLDQDKIILWDQQTKDKYKSFCEAVKVEMVSDDNE